MSDPTWLTQEVILAIQEELLERFGGLAGVRDEGLLESALNRPKHFFTYSEEKPSCFAMAAAYASGIMKKHPFLDGNKRAGFMAAYTFLGVNGHRFQAPEEEVVERTVARAAGAITEADYATWLEASCRP